MQTFSITILGCRVNHYESEQIAQVLRGRGLTQVDAPAGDVRVIHTCSVTMQAAKGSRQAVRRATRLPVLGQTEEESPWQLESNGKAKVIVTGCWATSDRAEAEKMPGVDAVITHHDDINERLEGLLAEWLATPSPPEGEGRVGAERLATAIANPLNERLAILEAPPAVQITPPPTPSLKGRGGEALPFLHDHQSAHQRAFLKIQDGCDAHCTYCIIPQLRPQLWSKSAGDAVAEAQALVDSGHKEIVLTGIFLGAFGQATALRRRQDQSTSKPIAALIEALCTQVKGLNRLRLSSLEPGDLDEHLIESLRRHKQLVPHFHLPLQSGSDEILRKMNRQYTRTQFLEMVAMVQEAFDRPAITTDIIVGFPGETEQEFHQTLDVVDRARFIHTHAFSYSPRPKTAAARWTKQFVKGNIANDRIRVLNDRAQQHSYAFRNQFVGQAVEVLVERGAEGSLRHGRAERYFDVHFESAAVQTGQQVRVRVEQVTPTRTHGRVIE